MNLFDDLFYISKDGSFKPKGMIKEGEDLKTKYFETRESIAVSCLWDPGYREKRNCVGEMIVPAGVKKLGNRVFAGMKRLRKVVLPDSLESIEDGAFEESSIESISVPDSVTTIGECAFCSCSRLVRVHLPSHLKEISERMFENCHNLTKIQIPETVTTIGSFAFWGCERISHVFLPKNVRTMDGHSTFALCASLERFEVAEDNRYLSAIGNMLFDKDKEELISCPTAKGSIRIPETVKKIRTWAFRGCRELTDVEWPSSLMEIGDNAFCGCGLSSVVLPETVESIGDSAFRACFNLHSIFIPRAVKHIGFRVFASSRLKTIIVDKQNPYFSSSRGLVLNKDRNEVLFCPSGKKKVTIPSSVTRIGDAAFIFCFNLEKISFSPSIKEIGDWAFAFCDRLKTIRLPDSVESIGEKVFGYCENLRNLYIPASVERIGKEATLCPDLKSVEVAGDNPIYCSVNGMIFDKQKTCLFKYTSAANGLSLPKSVNKICSFALDTYPKTGEKICELAIPDQVTEIEEYAFCGASGIEKITLPGSVRKVNGYTFATSYVKKVVIQEGTEEIGDCAFASCDRLEMLHFPKSLKKIGKEVFMNCRNIASILFNGTIDEWNMIEKGQDWWFSDRKNCTLICSDGNRVI